MKIVLIKKIFIILTLVLTATQIFVSPKQSLFYRSEIDLVKTKERMNEYPPKFYRLAHILEERKESVVLNKIQNNFFEIFDLKSIYFIFIPFLFVGFFRLIEKKEFNLLIFLFLLPVIVLSIFGTNKTYGNFCFYPFFIISLFYGFNKIFYKK